MVVSSDSGTRKNVEEVFGDKHSVCVDVVQRENEGDWKTDLSLIGFVILVLAMGFSLMLLEGCSVLKKM
jgi:hypothetical protein